MTEQIRPEDLTHDGDQILLADMLLRSLHRRSDGHLASAYNTHKAEVLPSHNVAILYCYTFEDDLFTLHYHYLHSEKALSLSAWGRITNAEAFRLVRHSAQNFRGVYGWVTAHIQITPLREDDVFIKIDDEGARGVRLSFSARKNSGKSQKKTRKVNGKR